MTADPDIIEAAARAANAWSPFWDEHEAEEVAIAIVAAITPLIEAAALERAAKVAEYSAVRGSSAIAAAIRALKEQP